MKNEFINFKNVFSLTNLEITGSNLGGPNKCYLCEEGKFLVMNGINKVCKECPRGQTYLANICTQCPKGYINDGTNNGICKKCPDYTNSNEMQDKCIVLQIMHNRDKNLLFYTEELNNYFKQFCEYETCYDDYLGPIKSKFNDSTLFFFSIFEQKKLKLSHIYRFLTDEISSGHIYSLSFNRRKLENIAGKIDSIKLFNLPFGTNGYIIKYTSETTYKDSRYISNLFITCSKNDEDYTPKLIHKIGDFNFIFEMKTRFGCRNCLLNEGVCKDQKRVVLFIENQDCIIKKMENNLKEVNTTFDNVLNYDDISKDEILSFYFITHYKRDLPDIQIGNTSEEVYANINETIEPCSEVNGISDTVFLLIIIIPLIYLITISSIVVLCCKYRRVKHEYESLQFQKENSREMELPKQGRQIEILDLN